jgi:5-methylcytosine-specific restriction endonuclease McrA
MDGKDMTLHRPSLSARPIRASIKSHFQQSDADLAVMHARELLNEKIAAAKAARYAKIMAQRGVAVEAENGAASKACGGQSRDNNRERTTTGAVAGTYVKTLKKDFLMSERLDIAARQGWKCYTCVLMLPAVFEIDHIIARHLGGAHSVENACALCRTCHGTKTRKERQDCAHLKRSIRAGQQAKTVDPPKLLSTVAKNISPTSIYRPPRRGAALLASEKIQRIQEEQNSTPFWDQ